MFRPVRNSKQIVEQYGYIAINHDIGLIPAGDVSELTPTELAKTICDAAERAALFIAQLQGVVLGDAVAIHKTPSAGAVLLGISDGQQQIEVIPHEFSSTLLDGFGNSLPELVESELKDRYGEQGLVIYGMPSKLLLASDFRAAGSSGRLNELGAVVAEVERRANGLSTPGYLELRSEERLLDAIRTYHVCSAENMEALANACKQAVDAGSDPVFSQQILETMFELYEISMKDQEAHVPIADIFWESERIGHVGIRREDREMATEFYDDELQKRLSAYSPQKKQNTPSFISQMLPGETGDDQQTVLKTIRHGLNGLGNISIQTDDLPLRPHDVKGISIGDVAEPNRVFNGAVYGVIRPSMVKDNQSIHLEPFQHQQYKNDRDEVAVSGMQPKTMVHIKEHGSEYAIYHSSLRDPATHLLKIPKDAIDKNSTLGGREWLSMEMAKYMGLEVPEFGLVDLNKTTRQYVAADEIQEGEEDINIEAVDFKQQIFGKGVDLGEGLSDFQLFDEFEQQAGQQSEPPGYIIELFTVPSPDKHGKQKFMLCDFCNLMGLDSGQRFQGTFETAAAKLKEHSTDFDSDRYKFLKRFMTSYLMADGDLHLKNISLLGSKEGGEMSWRLSPAYDILSMAGLSGYRVESALTVNGTHEPTKHDFAQAALNALDIEPIETMKMHSELTHKAIDFLTQFRGAPTLSAPSKFDKIPDVIRQHRATDRAIRDMVNGMEMGLTYRGSLQPEQVDIIRSRVESENVHVYKESISLFSTTARDSDIERPYRPGLN